MGVLGLWRLVDATGKPVPLETLEGKVLAIDVSIWIHQVIQGYQDRRGNMLPNAHLIGLFNRICKLMYFKIKPVFVFDGGVPLLKKNTIATRRKLKNIAATKAQKLKNDLINNLIKHTAVKGALDKGNDEGESSTTQELKDSSTIAGTSKLPDMYKLPDIPIIDKLANSEDYIDSDDENELELSPRKQTKWKGNIHSVDVNTEEFKSLPADVRYDILTDLKETRKQNSWGRLHELPRGSHNYCDFQVNRLLKRRYVQESLEEAEKEMGGKTLTLEELDRLLTDQGISTTQDDRAFRIASDSTTRVVYVKDKSSLPINENSSDSSKTSIKNNENSNDLSKTLIQNNENSNDSSTKSKSNKSKEQDSNLIEVLSDSMSVNSDNSVAVIDNMREYDLGEDWKSDDDFTLDETALNETTLNETTLNETTLNYKALPKSDIPKSMMNPALAYMLENTGFTRDQILKIVEQTKKNKTKSDASSHTSSTKGKRTPRRLSIRNRKRKKKLFESTMVESPKIKKEVVDDSENSKITESNSESDEFVDVPEKSDIKTDPDKTITMESSDTDSDNFVEISEAPALKLVDNNKVKSNSFQITIKADENLEDDIFADVFSDLNTDRKDENIKEKPLLGNTNKELKDDIFADVFVDLDVKKADPSIEDKPLLGNTNNELKDDIFADVFVNDDVKKADSSIEEKPLLGKIQGKVSKDDKLSDILSAVKEQLFEAKKELEKSFQEPLQNPLISLTPENSQLEFSTMTLPTTPEKVNSNIETNNVLNNFEGEENEIFSNQLTTETETRKENDKFIDDELQEKDYEDSGINDVNLENSEESSKINTIEEFITDTESQENEKEAVEKEKEPAVALPLNEEELESMKKQLEAEQEQITGTLGKLERQATDITDQMRVEAQELLRLFGVPYIVAPMEAEAQCAYLEQIKLTDGTITDDSDIWLFGGHCVYKNFFDNNKRVLQFLSDDIEHHFKLTRKEMILLALLVGSDYTTGLAGVGPVTALEILASFPSEGEDHLRGLRSFCSWLRAGRLTAPGKSTLRNKLKNIQIEKGFPSQAVVQAYLAPMVDESNEPFSWNKPNLVLLADYVKKKFGWTKLKFDEIINPVMKRLTENKSQKGIDSYFKVYTVPKSIEAALSKRVQTAVKKLGGKNEDDENSDEEVPSTSSKGKVKRVRKTAGKKGKKSKTESDELPTIPEASQDEPIESSSNVESNKDEDKTEVPNEDDEKINEAIKRIRRRKVIDVDEEVIPQREKDKANALNSKLKAIEIFRKSKMDRVKKAKKVVKKIKKDAELSESSSD